MQVDMEQERVSEGELMTAIESASLKNVLH